MAGALSVAGATAYAAVRAVALAEGDTVVVSGAAGASAATLAELAGLIAGGQLEVPVAATFPLSQVQDAYRQLAGGHLRGKIVLTA